MEKLSLYNKLNVDIDLIEEIRGGNRYFDIYFTNGAKEKFKLQFKHVFDLRYAIENGFIDRVSKISGDILRSKKIFLLTNSDYFNHFVFQVSGTIPTDNIKHYLLFDRVDTGIELLTISEPILIKA